ncbi:MAG: STAS domain-containing protein [Defluviitaleaceae bacterium]|nr:STAS domain-containing protein [Defluviitaleaceae bacterium]
MEFSIKEGKETYVTLAGKLDFARAPKLMDALAELKGKDISTIVFECAELTYISSSGIRVIIFAQQKIASGMTIVMVDVNEEVMEVLDICGLADFIEFKTSS